MFSQRVAFKAMHQPLPLSKPILFIQELSLCTFDRVFASRKVFYKSSVSLSKADLTSPRYSTDIHFLAECHTKSARELDNEKTFRATCLVNRLSRIRTSPDFFFALDIHRAKYKLSQCLKIVKNVSYSFLQNCERSELCLHVRFGIGKRLS